MLHSVGMRFILILMTALTCLYPATLLTGSQAVDILGSQKFANLIQDLSSKENEIRDFYAFGADPRGNSIVASTAGGFVTFRGELIKVMPWYASHWHSQNLWVISLVNVSRSDFYIINLYLDGSFDGTPLDGFWIFEYAMGTNQWVGPLVGTQRLNYTIVKTPSIIMPKIELFPYPKVWNALRASGSSFSVDAQRGFLIWENKNLTLYPILNLLNVTDIDSTWHELWALLSDPVEKSYFFAIFYMDPTDTSHVKNGLMLRLDDYMLLVPPIYTIDAHWSYVAELRRGGRTGISQNEARKFDNELLLFLGSMAIVAFIILAGLTISTCNRYFPE